VALRVGREFRAIPIAMALSLGHLMNLMHLAAKRSISTCHFRFA
jgi:hypothetical protein